MKLLFEIAAQDYALVEENINTYKLTPAQIAEKAFIAGVIHAVNKYKRINKTKK